MRVSFTASTETMAKLHAAIGTGKENAVNGAELCRAFDLEPRELRKALQLMRERGALICGSFTGSGGYFKPKNADEALEYVRTKEKRLATERRTLRKLKQFAKESQQ